MSTNSSIEWTDATWNPVSGCTRVSAGCDNCYAVKQTYRLGEMGQKSKYGGLTVLNPKGERHFNGVVRTSETTLTIPLKRKKPTKYFVNSMSDLFHRDVPFEFIDKVFAVMALCPQHTFQILTKRPERMAEYLADAAADTTDRKYTAVRGCKVGITEERRQNLIHFYNDVLPNVWLGTSVEDQQRADERIPRLLKCPAAVRFLSAEPLLGPIDLWPSAYAPCPNASTMMMDPETGAYECCKKCDYTGVSDEIAIDWVIAGGESGPGARPCNVEWIRSIVGQCKAAGVASFVKQLGKWVDDGRAGTSEKTKEFCVQRFLLNDGSVWVPPILRAQYHPEAYDQRPLNAVGFGLTDPKGGSPHEWPADLRVREFPSAAVPA